MLFIIIISLGQILLSYISNTSTHSVVIVTHYKHIHVIIPKPMLSSREGINSRCCRFD